MKPGVSGYLPNNNPPHGLVALLCGFHPNTVLLSAIGMEGIALMQEHKVNMFEPLPLALGAVIMVIGIGGNIGYEGGFLPITIPGLFPTGLPAIATAAVVG
jgi:uracil permease